jgi:hypothetical protein
MDWRPRLDKIISDAEAGERTPLRQYLPRLRPYLWDAHTFRVLGAGLAVIAHGTLRLVGRGLGAAFADHAEKPAAKKEKPTPQGTGNAGPKKAKSAKKPAVKKAPSLADQVERLAVGALSLLIAGVVAVTAAGAVTHRVARYLPAAVGVGIVVLLVAAFIVAPDVPRKPKKTAETEPAEDLPDDSEDDPQDTPEGRRLAFLLWLEKTTRGTPGIHLDQMHRQLLEEEFGRGFPRHYLRPLLDQYQIPVQRTLRVGPVAGRSGVTRQAIEEAARGVTAAPPLAAESGVESRVETVVDLPVSTDSPGALQAVESGA